MEYLMKLFSRILVVAPILAITGCTSFGVAIPNAPTSYGVLYTDIKSPVNPDEQMKHRKSVRPTKGGRACSYTILGLVAFGDNSFGKAVRVGDITTVSSVDTSLTGVPLFASGKVCTVVEGN